MGFLDRFFKKKPPVIPTPVSVGSPPEKAPVEPYCTGLPWLKNFKKQPSPLRGYMTMGEYKVTGINPVTGRKNTKKVVAIDVDKATQKALDLGLVEPIQCEELQLMQPIEEQIQDFKDSNYPIPPFSTYYDLRELSGYSEDSPEIPNVELVEYACHFDLNISFFAYPSGVIGCLMSRYRIGGIEEGWQPIDAITFYVYSVHALISGFEIGNLFVSPYAEDYKRIANKIVKNAQYKKYIINLSARKMLKPHRGSVAFAAVVSELEKLEE